MKNINGLVLLISLFLFHACKELPTQDLNKIFKDKNVPKHLLRLQTQKADLTPTKENQIIKRIKEDSQRSDLVTVAVIDSGFDLYHPDLINQIQFSVKDGKIVGAGHNFMSNQPFASHYAIDASLYSLLASKTSFQTIERLKDQGNPLTFLKELNDEFRKYVIDGIKKDPELGKSYFGFIGENSFHFLSFQNDLKYYDIYIEEYEKNKMENELIGLESKPTENFFIKKKKELDLLKTNGFVMNFSGETPPVFNTNVEHYDKFIALVRSAAKAIESKHGIQLRIENLARFSNIDYSNNKVKAIDKAIERISETMPLLLFGEKIHDPLARIEQELMRNPGYENLSLTEALSKYKADIELNIKEYDFYYKDQNQKEIKALKEALYVVDNLINAFDALAKDEKAKIRYLSELRKLTYRSHHPFLAPYSSSNNHGTHVAATIAAQSKNVRILPVVITTTTRSLTDEEFNLLQKEFFDNLQEFKKDSYYSLLLGKLYSEFPDSRALSERTIDKLLLNYIKANKLNLVFISEFIKSIKYVGESNAKIVSVSLGTVFEKKIGSSQWKESLVEELFSEFMRYKAGEYIEKYAKNKLFLIASGNDNAWIDGVTRTAMPVGIVSQRLYEIALKNNLEHSPNNRIDNILAVGSVSEFGYLSQFTNFSIGKIKQIFSVGEDVVAAYPRNTNNDRSKKLALKLMDIESGVLPIKLSSYDNKNMQLKELPNIQLYKEIATFVRLSFEVIRGKMSGTSMATPNTSGSLAKRILEMMKFLNVNSKQLDSHPEFTPTKLIAELFKMGAPLPISQDGSLIGIYKDIEKVPNDPNDRHYSKFEKDILTKPRFNKHLCAQLFN